MRNHPDCLDQLQRAGFSFDDAAHLRRIAMTLHRWHELECGDSNDRGAWCLVRGYKNADEFVYDDDGKPYNETHYYFGPNPNTVKYWSVPDRERGARKRLARIMARYPDFWAYVQTDPRGAALYVGHHSNTPLPIDANYSRGIAIHR